MQEFFDPSFNITHYALGDVQSTNDDAFRLGDETGAERLFVTAKRQLAGRGRRGRPWISEEGNLYASLFQRCPAPIEKCAELSFVAALSLQQALATALPEHVEKFALKWPNDVLLNDAKIAGLLLEARGEGDTLSIVIGMGVNCLHSPKDTPYPATNLKQHSINLKPDALFALLKHRLLKNVELWSKGCNFSIIRKQWLERAVGLGEPIIVRLDNDQFEGTFQDLDDEGHLVLGLSRGKVKRITAGDVFFPHQIP